MLKSLDIWLPAWLARPAHRPPPDGVRHVLLCVCDHFEPLHHADKTVALERIAAWQRGLRDLTREFRDSDQKPPRHSFFYPVEQYDRDLINPLAELCHETGSECEIHLHHDRDTAENLRRRLEEAKERLAGHGLLSRDEKGALRYGFIHGNWALDNSHPEGRFCGVHNELAVLLQTGCYADLTMPSAPDRTQTRIINSLYYATASGRPKSHDRGRPVVAGKPPKPQGENELLMVQGPLGLNWRWRKFGFLPRIENGDLTGGNPPTLGRFRLWQECQIRVQGQPGWYFVKLHTHGALPSNSRMFLGEPMRAFHRTIAQLAQQDPSLRFHYVSARELVNLVHAAEAGHGGEPDQFRNFRYRLNSPGRPVGSDTVSSESHPHPQPSAP